MIFQAVNKRMKEQGPHRTYNIPKQYKDQFDMVRRSPTTVVWITELDNIRITIGVEYTTLSGKN